MDLKQHGNDHPCDRHALLHAFPELPGLPFLGCRLCLATNLEGEVLRRLALTPGTFRLGTTQVTITLGKK